MTDYSQFEAESKSGIHAEPRRARKQDLLVRKTYKQRYNSIGCFIICLILTVGTAFVHWALAIVFGLAAAFFLWRSWGTGLSDEYIAEIYEEGLLVPGMIVSTQPLTVLAIASLVAQEGAPAINGCYKLVVEKLEGAKNELYEKIPCSCFFRYEGGSYHSSFDPHPLYWGTSNMKEIEEALNKAEQDNKENSKDEWEVLKQVAEQFPSLEHMEIILLDENYVPFGKKKYWETGYKPIDLDTEHYESGSITPFMQQEMPEFTNIDQKSAPYLTQDIPGKDVYNKMIELACRFNVYQYISGHCETGQFINAEHPGLYTYIGDSTDFLQQVKDSGIELSSGEYPLIFSKYLITNKGCYEDGGLCPWGKLSFSIQISSIYGMKIYVNDKKIAEIATDFDSYPDIENMPSQEKIMAAQKEAGRLLRFFAELKNNNLGA